MTESKHTPAERIVFEPHNGFGGDFCGEEFPFGYISHESPRMPIFELDVIVGDDFEAMRATAEKMVRAYNAHDDMLEALKAAKEFITNGIELGFIRMPDTSTPDRAHETPGIVRAAIARAEGRSEGGQDA